MDKEDNWVQLQNGIDVITKVNKHFCEITALNDNLSDVKVNILI